MAYSFPQLNLLTVSNYITTLFTVFAGIFHGPLACPLGAQNRKDQYPQSNSKIFPDDLLTKTLPHDLSHYPYYNI